MLVVTGIVVGLTVVVDDLVTDTDGLVRRIAHHRETGTSAPVWTAIVETTSGLKRSALVAALVVAVMLTPLFFLWDDGAAFLPPLVLSYLLAVATALVVGLVLTPVLAMLPLSSGQQRRPALTRVLHRRYDRTAPRMVARTGAAVATLAVLAVAGLLAMPFLDTALRPELQERSVLVDVQAAPGTSLPRMTAIADQAVEELGDLPGITAASAQIGRAVMSDQIVDVDQGEIWLTLDREADYASTVASVEDAAADLPGVVTEVSTYTAERVGETLQGDDSDVVVRAYGNNPEVLAAKAEELRGAIADVDGVTRVNVEPTPQESTVEVQVDSPGRRPWASSPVTSAGRRPSCSAASRSATCSSSRRSSTWSCGDARHPAVHGRHREAADRHTRRRHRPARGRGRGLQRAERRRHPARVGHPVRRADRRRLRPRCRRRQPGRRRGGRRTVVPAGPPRRGARGYADRAADRPASSRSR